MVIFAIARRSSNCIVFMCVVMVFSGVGGGTCLASTGHRLSGQALRHLSQFGRYASGTW